MPEQVDDYKRRCPKLGGEVPFSYCRVHPDYAGPCPKVLDCWWEIFDVKEVLRQALPPDEYDRLASARPPASKMFQILDSVQQAKKAKTKSPVPRPFF